ncbi:hypothetical protein E2562_015864 [Oryza meyeriana var. granulata]|uniref:Uncharacterized protein n=1 Tax=Oryza meyeriana var. granulata TaxID=110450 RepID=A0A6G1D4Q0_9ORYZ|nr:hypothetical protein E2562_015864 [Oryza meyeriana var. granulata]
MESPLPIDLAASQTSATATASSGSDGEDENEPASKRAKKSTSEVWQYFTKYTVTVKDEFLEMGGDYVLGDDDDMPEVQL